MISQLKSFMIFLSILLVACFSLFLVAGNSGENDSQSTQVRTQRPQIKTDLAVENFICSKEHTNDGDKVTIGFRVKNLGRTNVKRVPYELELKGRGHSDRHYEYLLASGILNDILVDSQKDFSREFIVPWNIDDTKIIKIHLPKTSTE